MAVRRPKLPTQPKRQGGKPVAPAVTGNIYEPPAQRRSKPFSQTATPRTTGAEEGDFQATAAPIPLVRRRGSKFGQYLPESESEDFVFPQIDPTATTNPSRPRTLQAGYHRERDETTGRLQETGTLRVRFRDGTPWAYYDVPVNVWRNFRRVKSPGRFVNRVLNNYDYSRGAF